MESKHEWKVITKISVFENSKLSAVCSNGCLATKRKNKQQWRLFISCNIKSWVCLEYLRNDSIAEKKGLKNYDGWFFSFLFNYSAFFNKLDNLLFKLNSHSVWIKVFSSCCFTWNSACHKSCNWNTAKDFLHENYSFIHATFSKSLPQAPFSSQELLWTVRKAKALINILIFP